MALMSRPSSPLPPATTSCSQSCIMLSLNRCWYHREVDMAPSPKGAFILIGLMVIMALVGTAVPPVAWAGQFDTSVERCRDPDTDPDLRIRFCSWLLNSNEIAKQSRYLVFSNRGNAWKAKGELDRAIADYTEAIRLKPDHAIAHYDRGIVWQQKGELDRAIADFSEAIRLKPYDTLAVYAYVNRGLTWKSVV